MELPLIITLSIVLIILIILLALSNIVHNKAFGNRYKPDPIINYYTSEEFNLNKKEVQIRCGKEILRGSIYNYDNPIEDKIVVFAHGMWSSTKAYIQDIEYLCRAGYMVLGFDYVGTDLSSGKSIKGLASGLKSLDYAIKYVKHNYPNKEIYVVGHSWGAFNTLNVTNYHKDIKKVVAMAPFLSIARVYKGMLSKKLWVLIPFMILIEYIKCGKYAFANSLKSLNKFKGDAYILHSKNDNMVSYLNNTEVINKKCKNKKVIYKIVDNKFHNPNYSDSAIACMLSYSASLKGKSSEEIVQIKKNTDFHKLGELDSNIMDDIVKFLKQ